MNPVETLLAQPLVTALGWALIHFIWQGMLIALLLAGVLQVLRNRSTNTRYASACAALLLMLMFPLATVVVINLSKPGSMASNTTPIFAAQSESKSLTVEIEPPLAPTPTDIAAVPQQSSTSIWSVSLVPVLRWTILLWFLGVVFFSLRLTCGWLYTERLRSHGVRPVDDRWQQRLRQLCLQLRVTRPVRLLESTLVGVPTAIGWLRPVILLPISSLAGLSPQQLEAIIAHELAHIRRHDYLINLLQAMIETLMFYHPAVWWVSRRIRQEREHCCDDLAVAVCGDPLTYARALLEMEQLRSAGPQLAVAANGGLLMNRIERLIGTKTQYTNRFTGLFAGIMVVTTVVSIGVAAQISILYAPLQNEVAGRVETVRNESGTFSTPASSNKNERQRGQLSMTIRATAAGGEGIEQASPLLQWAPEQREEIPADVAKKINELDSPSPEERAAAACALGAMQAHAAPAIPYLIALMSDGTPIDPRHSCKNEHPFEDEVWAPNYEQVREPSPGEAATQALIAIGKPAYGPLMDALLHGEPWRIRKNAAWALAHRGNAVEQLIVALKDEAWQVRAQAAYALFQRGGSAPRVVSALIETALEDPAWQARAQATMALGQKGDSQIDVIVPLTTALKDREVQVRLEATNGLWQCADSRAFEPLLAALKDEHAGVRKSAARTLGNRAEDREVQLLIARLNDPDQTVRDGVRQALNVIKQRLNGRVTNLRRVVIPD